MHCHCWYWCGAVVVTYFIRKRLFILLLDVFIYDSYLITNLLMLLFFFFHRRSHFAASTYTPDERRQRTSSNSAKEKLSFGTNWWNNNNDKDTREYLIWLLKSWKRFAAKSLSSLPSNFTICDATTKEIVFLPAAVRNRMVDHFPCVCVFV